MGGEPVVKCSGIDFQHICKVNRPVNRVFIGAYHNKMLPVNQKAVVRSEQGADKLIGRGEIVETAQGSGVLNAGVMGVECN